MTHFNCPTCCKKFLKSDYKKPEQFANLYKFHEYRDNFANVAIKGHPFTKTKYFQHLVQPKRLPVRDEKYKCWRVAPKPFHFVCPKSVCILCYSKTGKSPSFSNRDQFNYHRRKNCPYKDCDYKQFIKSQGYDEDTTFATMLECDSDPEPEPEPEPEPVVEEKEEDEDPPVHTYFSLDKSPAELARIRREAMKRAKANGEPVTEKTKKKTNKKKEYDMINKNLELQIKEHQEEMNLV